MTNSSESLKADVTLWIALELHAIRSLLTAVADRQADVSDEEQQAATDAAREANAQVDRFMYDADLPPRS